MKALRLTLAAAFAVSGLAQAATVTNTMPVQITIQNACDVTTTAPTALNFGTAGPLTANLDQTSAITLTCTSGTAYNVGLSAGGGTSTAARRMINGANQVAYQLYTTAARTSVWGNVVGTDTVTGSGSGSAQTLTVYGRVAPQTTPPAGAYTDSVTVTVTY